MNYILNDEQRRLVEEHLDIIDKVLRKTIHFNSGICGMEYDDLYQIGAIGLCKAAVTYQSGFDIAFDTYASCAVPCSTGENDHSTSGRCCRSGKRR